MKTIFFTVALAATLFASCGKTTTETSRVITTPISDRVSGQSDVLELKVDPIPTVRVAFIGLGMRGPGAVNRMTHIPGV